MTKDQKRKLCEQLDDLEGRIVSLMVRIEKMDDDPAELLCSGCVRDDLRQHLEICFSAPGTIRTAMKIGGKI